MTESLHYNKPPIQEATLEILTELPDNTTLSDIEQTHQFVKQDYPFLYNTFLAEIKFEDNIGSSPIKNRSQTGYRFVREDRKQMSQFRLKGFSLSILHPYDRWEIFCSEAKRLWDIYQRTLKPNMISQLGLRYINRIDIPSQQFEVSDYLRTTVVLSPELPQNVQDFFCRVVLPYEEIQATAFIQQGMVPSIVEGGSSIMLDIDLIRDTDVPQDQKQIWELFDRMRYAKNHLFKSCITENTERLFE